MDVIRLGPILIHVWGLFVATAFIVGTWLASRRAPRYGILPKDVVDFSSWCIVAAFLGARLSHVFLYEPGYYLANPGDIVKVWEGGLSSFGGFIGALVAAMWFIRKRRIPFLRFSDTLLGALPIAYAIGRIGCAVTYMHPGVACDAAAVCRVFPDGVQRLDLGLLEAFLWIGIAIAISKLHPIRSRLLTLFLKKSGGVTAVVVGMYGFGRFLLDFQRVADVQYAGLTPAQYGSLALIAVAVWLSFRVRRSSAV